MLRISFNVTKDDAVALALDYYSASPTVHRDRMLVQWLVPLLLAILGLLDILQNEGDLSVGVASLVSAGVLVIFLPRLYRLMIRKRTEKMMAESSYQKAFGPSTLTLSEDGLTSSGPIGEGKYYWEAVARVSFTPEHLFIMLAGPAGIAIPRAQIPDSTIQEVKTFVESHMRSSHSA